MKVNCSNNAYRTKAPSLPVQVFSFDKSLGAKVVDGWPSTTDSTEHKRRCDYINFSFAHVTFFFFVQFNEFYQVQSHRMETSVMKKCSSLKLSSLCVTSRQSCWSGKKTKKWGHVGEETLFNVNFALCSRQISCLQIMWLKTIYPEFAIGNVCLAEGPWGIAGVSLGKRISLPWHNSTSRFLFSDIPLCFGMNLGEVSHSSLLPTSISLLIE